RLVGMGTRNIWRQGIRKWRTGFVAEAQAGGRSSLSQQRCREVLICASARQFSSFLTAYHKKSGEKMSYFRSFWQKARVAKEEPVYLVIRIVTASLPYHNLLFILYNSILLYTCFMVIIQV